MDPEAKRRRHRRERIAAAIFVALVASAVGGFMIWNHRDRSVFLTDLTYVPKKANITPEVNLLRDYVRIDTGRQNEIEGARFLVAELAKRGVQAELIESAPGRGNVYARIRGKKRGSGLLLLHHIDVVGTSPAGWWDPPFSGVIKVNMLFGRGTLDMKGIGICHLLAFSELARGATPEHDVVFLAVADEETGGTFGMQWLLDNRPDLFEGIRYSLNEGGITEMLREKPTYFGIEIGGKTLTSVNLRGTRENLRRARIALEPSMSSRRPERVLPAVRTFFRHLAPHRLAYRDLLIDIDATIARDGFWRLPRGYRELTQNTVFPRGVRDEADGPVMRTLLYNLPDEDPDRRLAWLQKTVAPFDVTIGEVIRKDQPVPMSPEETPMFELVRREVQRMHGNVAVGPEVLNSSTNDSRFLRRRGIVAYGVSPFFVDVGQSSTIHGVNEGIRLDWFMDGIELTRRIVRSYATTPAN